MGFSEDPGMCAKYCSCRKHGTDEIAALREKALVLTSAPRYVEGMGGGSNLFTTKMLACLRGERATVSLHQLKECVYEGVLGEFSLSEIHMQIWFSFWADMRRLQNSKTRQASMWLPLRTKTVLKCLTEMIASVGGYPQPAAFERRVAWSEYREAERAASMCRRRAERQLVQRQNALASRSAAVPLGVPKAAPEGLPCYDVLDPAAFWSQASFVDAEATAPREEVQAPHERAEVMRLPL
ncbi:unnamed protein product [Polarella glacialis]|uniref:Uncharacterized protein n=1 Tax=Polarella glacialis TaxID=89957 RepID=A0A813G084_POLGL|nr:unnamed protein product [Polarella glacialis]